MIMMVMVVVEYDYVHTCCIFPGDYGCIVNGELCWDQTDPIGGSRGVMMKICTGKWLMITNV